MNAGRYDRHSKSERVEEILGTISSINNHESRGKGSGKSKVGINGQKVNVRSLRLRTFAKFGPICALCGLKGTFFALERNWKTKAEGGPYHINLYGVDGDKEVLFTHDHKKARSKGGADNLSNTQTACYPCNQKKADK